MLIASASGKQQVTEISKRNPEKKPIKNTINSVPISEADKAVLAANPPDFEKDGECTWCSTDYA